jgi:hypothetical protein
MGEFSRPKPEYLGARPRVLIGRQKIPRASVTAGEGGAEIADNGASGVVERMGRQPGRVGMVGVALG